MSPFKRPESAVYYLDVRWRGYPRLRLSTDTTNKRRADDIERTLYALRRAGRRDILELLASRRLRLPEVHDAYTRDPAALEQLKARAASPRLGELVDRWLGHLRSAAGVSPRTKRRYAPTTVNRYSYSWAGFFAVLPEGRNATLTSITRGFVLEYRRTRTRATGGKRRIEVKGATVSAATLNRDLAALGAFLTWLRDVEGVPVERLQLPRERESRGRERWLSSEELARFQRECAVDWWPFFATLFYTGARLGEVQGLRGGDVLLHAKRVLIHEGARRVKTKEAIRDLPIAPALEAALAGHLTRVAPGPDDLVFAGAYQDYGTLRRVWNRTCRAAKVAGATPHDARHTFAVHAAQAGIPIVRLQKLLG
ncbi:MAG: tyrosine-type recombinase/integrase, partial [Gemmatimonadales bacterium]